MENLTLTSLEQLQEYSKGQIVELPPFAEGQQFVARLRRPSMLAMTKSGKIPNELLISVTELFSSNRKSSELTAEQSLKIMRDTYDLFEIICDASFVSPTYQEIKDAGIELTDDQKSFVYQYSQKGIKALSNFRTE